MSAYAEFAAWWQSHDLYGEDMPRVAGDLAREVIAGKRNAWAASNHLEIAIWGWRGMAIPALEEIFMIDDEIDWDRKHRRPLEQPRTSLLDCFASLARLADNEVVA